jgi:3-oxoadipate enol-lactonase
MDACIGFDNKPHISGISVPTLILVGANDVVTPPSCSDELARQLPTAIKKEIEGAGHFVHVEKPDFISRELLEFWRMVEASEKRIADRGITKAWFPGE